MSEEAELVPPKILAVCIPLHDGKLCWQTWFQLRQEEQVFQMLGIPWRFDLTVIAGCSLISRARNEAVETALERGADALMWIDGDMNWSSGAIARLLAMDVDICGAAVPMKQPEIKWNVEFADRREPNEKGLIEVKSVGTGFLFTKRRVYEILKDRNPPGPENVYERPGGKGRGYAYFSAPGSWGEDTFLCHQWRSVGGKVFVDPAIAMEHVIAPSWSVKACLADWLAQQEPTKQDAA